MLLSRRHMLATIAAVPASLAVAGPAAATNRSMPAAAVPRSVPHRVMTGAAVRPDQLIRGSSLEPCIRRDCAILVPEFHGQWSAVEWIPGEPYFGNYDAIVDYARITGKAVRGHALLWEQMTPEWARAALGAERDWALVRRHFAHLLPRYSGRIGEWVVVNEMLDTEDGQDGLRRTSVQRAFGNDYIVRALETAHELDPAARLMINDYSLCHDNPVDRRRRLRMVRLVEELKTRGAPLHAVGLQGHIELAKGPIAQAELRQFLAELAAMDVTIAVTELDVLEDERDGPIEERDRRVADAVEALVDVIADQPAVTSLVTWGLSDRDSWLQERSDDTRMAQRCSPVDCAQLNRGLPYDGSLTSKPMRSVLARLSAA